MVEIINSSDDLKIYEKEKHFKVFAGPGAGKTHLIIENIKYIIQNSKKIDSDYRKILCITYTNIAADEITKRLTNYNQYAYVSTIHSFLYQNVIKVFQKQLKIIIKEMYNIDIPDNIDIKVRREGESILANTTVDIIKEWIRSQIEIDDVMLNRLTKKVMMDCVLSLTYRNKYPFDDTKDVPFLSDTKNKCIPKDLRLLIKKYLWSVQGVLDFDEILYFSFKLLKKYFFIKYDLRYKFPFVFVDEQQDTNPIQYEIIKLIFDFNDTTVGFVGDLAQSIYSFQGADYTMLDSATFESKEQLEYVIEGNKRSTENIINFCNYIRKKDDKLSKQKCKLNFDSNNKVKIVVLTHDDSSAIDFVDEDTVVLCRRFIDLIQYINMSDIEQKQAITDLYRKYTYTFNRDLVNDFIDENYEWIRVIKFICKMNSGIKNNNFPLMLNELKKYLNLRYLLKGNNEQIKYYKKFCNLITDFKEIIKQENVKFIDIVSKIDQMFTESIFEYSKKIYEKNDDKYEPCSEFLDIFTLKTAFEIGNKIFANNTNYKTIHKSKGKEYEKVLVDLKPSAINNESTISAINIVINPIIQSNEENIKEICEFVRIFYVAISRAINELVVVLEGNEKEAEKLETILRQYMIDEGITERFFEIIIM